MDKPKISEAKRRANKKWNDANMSVKYDHLHIVVPKGRKEDIEARAKALDKSINSYTNELYRGDLGLTEREWKGEDDEGH